MGEMSVTTFEVTHTIGGGGNYFEASLNKVDPFGVKKPMLWETGATREEAIDALRERIAHVHEASQRAWRHAMKLATSAMKS
jgi:hypothetical protein